MKYLYYFLILCFYFFGFYLIRLSDRSENRIFIEPAIGFLFAFFLFGIIYGAFAKKKTGTKKTIGWGMFYGSLTTAGLVVIFFAWLFFALKNVHMC